MAALRGPLTPAHWPDGGSTRRWTGAARQRAATVEYLVEAAAQVFGARGYAATTNEIAERAGVSVGTLYQYFADKDALLLALAERHLEQARDRLTATLQEVGEALDRDALVRAVVEAVVDVNRPTELGQLLHAGAPRTPELVAVLDRLRGDIAAAVAALLVRDGHPEAGAVRRANALVVAVDAAVHEHVLRAGSPTDEQDRTDDVVLLAVAALDAYVDAHRG